MDDTGGKWVANVEEELPSLARARDFLIGGDHAFSRDRVLADAMIRAMPSIRSLVRVEYAFANRVVRFLVDEGISQFLFLRPGIGSLTGVAEVIDAIAPESRLVWVDDDAITVAFWEMQFARWPRRLCVGSRLDFSEQVLAADSVVRERLDFAEPVALLAFQAHALSGSCSSRELIGGYMDVLAEGSYLAMSHLTTDVRADQVDELERVVAAHTHGDRWNVCGGAEISAFFDDLELVSPPGLVGVGSWRPARVGDVADDPQVNVQVLGGVGRKATALGTAHNRPVGRVDRPR